MVASPTQQRWMHASASEHSRTKLKEWRNTSLKSNTIKGARPLGARSKYNSKTTVAFNQEIAASQVGFRSSKFIKHDNLNSLCHGPKLIPPEAVRTLGLPSNATAGIPPRVHGD